MDDKIDVKQQVIHHDAEVAAAVQPKIRQQNSAMYEEALEKYGQDGSIDPAREKRLKRWVTRIGCAEATMQYVNLLEIILHRKLDAIILTCLGVCYFFYVSRCIMHPLPYARYQPCILSSMSTKPRCT
jgi:hypothetical protein